MKPIAIIGAVLIIAGLWVVINGASFTKDKTVFKAGPIEANVKQQESIPPWAGALAIAAGVGCIVVGVRRA